ncbi:hypothetical protein H5410_033478 [Solanum commersonii]|uniref:Uncharacterized protein n=1 Tax=Solanum commersonii TaxID=4109 RepID=A0A9J5YSP6_SOLCO|nr:hypothetical protein H5410_033478 [Solanum commersonii]
METEYSQFHPLEVRLDSKKKKEPFPEKKSSNKNEAVGNEWLETGNCPIAKSYRAVSGVLPIVASTFQLPPEIKLKCPPAVVAVRAALAKTVFVKTMLPQPLVSKMRFHAAVPFIAMLRKSVVMPKTAMALTIAAAVLGQVIGSRAERLRQQQIQCSPIIKRVTDIKYQ